MQTNAYNTFHTFLQVLRLHHLDLWEFKINKYNLIHSGEGQVLYSRTLDTLILRVHNNSWFLDKNLQVIGSCDPTHVDHGFQTYCISTPGGYHVLKFNQIDFRYGPDIPLQNFETLLQNRCSFVKNDNLAQKFIVLQEQKAHGLEGLIHKVVEGVTRNFASVENDNHPNQVLPRTLPEILDVDSHSAPVVDIPESDIQTYKTEVEFIIREHQDVPTWSNLWQGNLDQSVSSDLLDFNEGRNLQQSQGSQQFQEQTPPGLGVQQNQGIPQGQGFQPGHTFERTEGHDFQQQGQNFQQYQGVPQGQNFQQPQGIPQGQVFQQGQPDLLTGGTDQKSQIYPGQESALRNVSQQYQGVPQGQNFQNVSESTGERPGEEGYHDHKQPPAGRHHHDQQEVLGAENQRLPAYEVHQTTEHIDQGFKKAASHVYDGEQPSPVEKSESTDFTTGLLKDNLDTSKENVSTKPTSTEIKKDDVETRTESTEVKTPLSPYHKNYPEDAPTSFPEGEKGESKDLPKEALNMEEPWGSNVTNPSETTPSVNVNDLNRPKPVEKAGLKDVSNVSGQTQNFSPTKIRPGDDTRKTLEQVADESENLKETTAI